MRSVKSLASSVHDAGLVESRTADDITTLRYLITRIPTKNIRCATGARSISRRPRPLNSTRTLTRVNQARIEGFTIV